MKRLVGKKKNAESNSTALERLQIASDNIDARCEKIEKSIAGLNAQLRVKKQGMTKLQKLKSKAAAVKLKGLRGDAKRIIQKRKMYERPG